MEFDKRDDGRMACPFDIEIIAEIKLQGDLLALQLVDNGAVVDAMDRQSVVKQPAALLLHLRDVDGLHAADLFGQQEIGQRLLMSGIDFHEDHIFRLMVTHNRFAEEVFKITFLSLNILICLQGIH